MSVEERVVGRGTPVKGETVGRQGGEGVVALMAVGFMGDAGGWLGNFCEGEQGELVAASDDRPECVAVSAGGVEGVSVPGVCSVEADAVLFGGGDGGDDGEAVHGVGQTAQGVDEGDEEVARAAVDAVAEGETYAFAACDGDGVDLFGMDVDGDGRGVADVDDGADGMPS